MPRAICAWYGLFAAPVLLIAGCLSFDAVKNTGGLASDLGTHVDSLAYAGKVCEAVMVATSTSAKATPAASNVASKPATGPKDPLGIAEQGCAPLATDTAAWADILAGIVAYGKALKSLADAESLDVEGELEGLRQALAAAGAKGLEDKRAEAGVKAIQALAKLIVDEMRRKELTAFVKQANVHVQEATGQIIAHIGQQIVVIDAMHTLLKNNAADLISEKAAEDTFVCGPKKSAPVSGAAAVAPCCDGFICDAEEMRLALAGTMLGVEGWLLERQLALQRLRTGVAAFAKAHQVLFTNADRLGKQDAQHLQEIIEAVKSVYKESLKVATPPKEEENETGN